MGFTQMKELLNISAPETVNRLLAVSHNHIVISRCQAIAIKGKQILPLYGGGILKFVYHVVLVLLTNALVNEGHRFIQYQFVNQLVEIGKWHGVSFFFKLFKGEFDEV